jgi:hypothetical protein
MGQPGGEVRLTARTPRRREMIGIIDWRMEQRATRSVEFRFDAWAEEGEVLGEDPDAVIVATEVFLTPRFSKVATTRSSRHGTFWPVPCRCELKCCCLTTAGSMQRCRRPR